MFTASQTADASRPLQSRRGGGEGRGATAQRPTSPPLLPAQEPSFIAADPASSTVFVSCRTTADRDAAVSYSVAAFRVDAPPATADVSTPVTIRAAGLVGAAGTAPQWRLLTLMPPPSPPPAAGASPGSSSGSAGGELVVGDVGTPSLRVISLRDL